MSEQQVSDILFQSNVKRPIADYVPGFWGDLFLNYDFDEMAHDRRKQRLEELKEEVRRELLAYADHPLKQMSLIDVIQCLDVGYHFETEIEEALRGVYILYTSNHYNHEDENLYNVSLFFRILRQNGFKVSSGKSVIVSKLRMRSV
ncbi:hypothetical protein FEM48_Zijuj01G0219800 [Ziziphus jujuba var. spinosa]|uniref:Terpene synthase N-terminal domain-containing protein n=1 Tax=Ziziphus jujuba var. spinosa TaxID=714518 RepID=A0A978W3T0_ZIZJJ|nr:hypothetical protein FEM48_Zijuj01G0219800 [Ziziphus jujuba var. spinosa]